ncbi:uncharacterized protein LOC129569102 isoform X1 [Sitodiplosis mosellana]|uniref:uncharacterized protein LOC129569102 isoform X1 n=1 Tax=Sitodiplosis mosellana TaxID=263140 RepID=UPI002443AD7F|nr:uncharacterized protein LOC129569102 isoform X1 [Sitodiplosis mosellana]XP_055303530.1 uncharacterized protein LOC129569102 isoform X1 [Sitodiplosis mosellana]XP_055303531.1 uncharacterized protein LOC129569102 isoform X1 [Sitodiplosis mosellana]
MDVEIPPAQDSPKHILNILNDDCIQSVLRRLDNIRDFLSAAETCVRFQENAKLVFRTQYKTARIRQFYNYGFRKLYCSHDVIVRIHSFLSIFGHLITELDFDDNLDDDMTNMIAKYCGRTLRIFKCGNKKTKCFSSVNFSQLPRLESLEELKIRNINIHSFQYHSQLRRLSVKGIHEHKSKMNFDWLFKTFPNLEFVKLDGLDKLTCNQAIKFFKLNPQLKSLHIRYCEHFAPRMFKNMTNFTPNLEKFVFEQIDSIYENEYLVHVSRLQKLKSLGIETYVPIPLGRLIDSLIEKNVPIENLLLLSHYHQTPYESISQLKLLKKLYLRGITDKTFIHYVKNLPKLEVLFFDESEITVNGIKAALQYAQSLSVLVVEVHNRDRISTAIDLDEYKSILNLAKSRGVKVTIYVRSGAIDVPTDFFEDNREWVNVKVGVLHINTIVRHFNE